MGYDSSIRAYRDIKKVKDKRSDLILFICNLCFNMHWLASTWALKGLGTIAQTHFYFQFAPNNMLNLTDDNN